MGDGVYQTVWQRSIALSRLRNHFNSDFFTATAGSFDRYHWGWKKRDFPDATLAYAIVPLMKAATLFDEDESERLDQVVSNLLDLVHKDASFDQVYPFERHPKAALDITTVFALALKKQDCPRLRSLYTRIMDYSLKREEGYGVICNHLAHHAYEYLVAAEILNEERFLRKAEDLITVIFKNTVIGEGWHLEYLGADPGYQTRSLRYLTKCLAYLKGDAALICEELCHISASFLDRVVLPDGTLYAAFGSRNTILLYPSGIEFMAIRNPSAFSSLAARVRRSIKNSLIIEPLALEFDNFIRIFDDFLDADDLVGLASQSDIQYLRPKPFYLPEYGLECRHVGDLDVFVHRRYGGAIAVYCGEKCLSRNAGLLIETDNGRFFGSRNIVELAQSKSDLNSIEISTYLFPSIHHEMTPVKHLILRLLNLTVLRFGFFADLFRGILVRQMVTGKKHKDHGELIRILRFEESGNGKVEIEDCLSGLLNIKNVWRALNLNLFHMASSRYCYPIELGFKSFLVEKKRSCDKNSQICFSYKTNSDNVNSVEKSNTFL